MNWDLSDLHRFLFLCLCYHNDLENHYTTSQKLVSNNMGYFGTNAHVVKILPTHICSQPLSSLNWVTFEKRLPLRPKPFTLIQEFFLRFLSFEASPIRSFVHLAATRKISARLKDDPDKCERLSRGGRVEKWRGKEYEENWFLGEY